jgi:hypothetical protein
VSNETKQNEFPKKAHVRLDMNIIMIARSPVMTCNFLTEVDIQKRKGKKEQEEKRANSQAQHGY